MPNHGRCRPAAPLRRGPRPHHADPACSAAAPDPLLTTPAHNAGTLVVKNGLYGCSGGGGSVTVEGISVTGCKVVPTGIVAVIVVPIIVGIIACCLCCFFCKGCPGHTRRNAGAAAAGVVVMSPQQPGVVYMVPQQPAQGYMMSQQPTQMAAAAAAPAAVSAAAVPQSSPPKAAAPAPTAAALQSAPLELPALLQSLGMSNRMGALNGLGVRSVEDLTYADEGDLEKAGLTKVETRKLMAAAKKK